MIFMRVTANKSEAYSRRSNPQHGWCVGGGCVNINKIAQGYVRILIPGRGV